MSKTLLLHLTWDPSIADLLPLHLTSSPSLRRHTRFRISTASMAHVTLVFLILSFWLWLLVRHGRNKMHHGTWMLRDLAAELGSLNDKDVGQTYSPFIT